VVKKNTVRKFFDMSNDKKNDFSPKRTDKIKSLNYAVDHWDRVGLTGIDLAVWTVMFRFERDGFTTVSQQLIAQKTGCCVNYIKKSIKRLIEKKVIAIHEKGRSGISMTKYRMIVVPRKNFQKPQ
jgi:hypothetical protein